MHKYDERENRAAIWASVCHGEPKMEERCRWYKHSRDGFQHVESYFVAIPCLNGVLLDYGYEDKGLLR